MLPTTRVSLEAGPFLVVPSSETSDPEPIPSLQA